MRKVPASRLPMAAITANGLVYVGDTGGDGRCDRPRLCARCEDSRMVWRFDVVPGLDHTLDVDESGVPISGGASGRRSLR